jgi:hypothetical protein
MDSEWKGRKSDVSVRVSKGSDQEREVVKANRTDYTACSAMVVAIREKIKGGRDFEVGHGKSLQARRPSEIVPSTRLDRAVGFVEGPCLAWPSPAILGLEAAGGKP